MRVFILVVAMIAYVSADCGCLKGPDSGYVTGFSQQSQSHQSHQTSETRCSKHLQLVSPQGCPIQVIYRNPPPPNCEYGQLPYQVQTPVVVPNINSLPSIPLPSLKNFRYRLEPLQTQRFVAPDCHDQREYDYRVQTPIPVPQNLPKPKISIPLTGLQYRTDRVVLPAPRPPVQYRPSPVAPQLAQLLQNIIHQNAPQPQVQTGPTFENLPCDDNCQCDRCSCNRY